MDTDNSTKIKGGAALYRVFQIAISLMILFSPVLAYGADSKLAQRQKFFESLEQPATISSVEWMILQWKVRLAGLTDVALKGALQKNDKYCFYGEISYDNINKSFVVPMRCIQDILDLSKNERLEHIKKMGLGYVRIFLFNMAGRDTGFKAEDFATFFVFDASAMIVNKGELDDLQHIGSFKFGKAVLPKDDN